MTKRNITLIAGPTASGKSNFAINLAKNCGGIIINADSMQVYDVLRIITARPSIADMHNIRHCLYGHISPKENYSTGKWLQDVTSLLNQEKNENLIFVGGTGLYFKALIEGLAEIPNIDNDIREFWRQKLRDKGSEKLYQELVKIDKDVALKIKEQDGQRIIRALEVFTATGKPLSFWQNNKTKPLINANRCDKIILLPERDQMYYRINNRFDVMVEEGALEEVKNLQKMQLIPKLPAMKAIGVPEFLNVLNGLDSLTAAIEAAKMQTRRYAKRQMTWFRHQLSDDWQKIKL